MLRTIFLSIAAAMLFAPAQSAPLLINGSFEEAPDVAGKRNGRTFEQISSGRGRSWDVWDSLPGWQASSGYGIEVQSRRTLGFIDAADGEHYVELDSNNNSSIFQDVVLGAGRYQLGFSYSPRRRSVRTNPIQYSVGNLVDGWVTGPDSGRFPRGEWTRVRALFDVVTPGMYRLTFAAGGTSDSFGGLLDRVSLSAKEDDVPMGIPLPASFLLLAGAVGGLVSMRRKSAPEHG